MQTFLENSLAIDWKQEDVLRQAQALADGCEDKTEIARRCFEWVRDNIKHSKDHEMNPVTWRASDVLRYGTGYCYAKSHLLAALLRANHIPAGLCYQRLSINDDGAPFCLHGLNAVYLEEYGWYRIDARGNKPGLDAQFTPPQEILPFPIREEQEADLPEIWSEPLPVVLNVLQNSKDYMEVFHNLPDIELLPVRQ